MLCSTLPMYYVQNKCMFISTFQIRVKSKNKTEFLECLEKHIFLLYFYYRVKMSDIEEVEEYE